MFNITPDKYKSLSNLMNYNEGRQDYILARLYLTKQFLENNESQKALDCINNIIDDIVTDYGDKLK